MSNPVVVFDAFSLNRFLRPKIASQNSCMLLLPSTFSHFFSKIACLIVSLTSFNLVISFFSFNFDCNYSYPLLHLTYYHTLICPNHCLNPPSPPSSCQTLRLLFRTVWSDVDSAVGSVVVIFVVSLFSWVLSSCSAATLVGLLLRLLLLLPVYLSAHRTSSISVDTYFLEAYFDFVSFFLF